MTTHATCRQCGAEFSTKALNGLCPDCVLLVAVAGDVGDDTLAPQKWTPPTVEGLSALLPPGRYTVESFIGRGGMGAVYKGTQLSLHRAVAIKIMRRDFKSDQGFAERFQREALAMAELGHPNIVAVIDCGDAGPDWLYIVMEFVDGVDLLEVIRDGGMTQEMALALVPQICDALQFAHDHGIVHRDVKPSNILLTRDGRIKIADFGLAKRVGGDASTQTGIGMGTPEYAAPEQFQPGADVDHRADIYALGVMMYQMLTGTLPRGAWPAPSKTPTVHPEWDAIVNRAIQARPEDRYASASAVKSDVTRIGTAPLVRAPSWKKRVAFAAAVIVVIAAGAWWYSNHRPHATHESSAVAAPPAPQTVLLFRGHRYEIDPGLHTWEQAKIEAERRGGHLATITNAEENDALVAAFHFVLDRRYANFFLGARRAAEDASWQWVTREPWTFTAWHPGEPNSIAYPDYLILARMSSSGAYAWDDVTYRPSHLDGLCGFIIEWESEYPPAPKTGSPVVATTGAPFVNSLGMKFVPVTTTADGHAVHFSVWEVRNSDYAAYAAARPEVNLEWKISAGLPDSPDHPVVMINWTDALSFTHWLTDHDRAEGAIGPYDRYRLPTDREWSAAVGLKDEPGDTPHLRSGTNPGYPWGDAWPPPAGAGNFADDTARELPREHPILNIADTRKQLADNFIPSYRDGFATTAPVGSFSANALGLHDLAGNVWEWCSDLYAKPGDRNPTRVLRGGAWTSGGHSTQPLRSVWRFDGMPTRRYAFRGIRVVLEVVK